MNKNKMNKLYILILLSLLLSSCLEESGEGVNNYYTATNVYYTTTSQVIVPATWGIYLANKVDKWVKSDDVGKEEIRKSIYPSVNIFANSDTIAVKVANGMGAFVYITKNKSIQDAGTSWIFGRTMLGTDNKTDNIFVGSNSYKLTNEGNNIWKIGIDKLSPNNYYDYTLSFSLNSDNTQYEVTGNGKFESYHNYKFKIIKPIDIKFDYNKNFDDFETIHYYYSGELEIQADNYDKQLINVRISSQKVSNIIFKNKSYELGTSFFALSSIFFSK